jgi:hypothetical protein
VFKQPLSAVRSSLRASQPFEREFFRGFCCDHSRSFVELSVMPSENASYQHKRFMDVLDDTSSEERFATDDADGDGDAVMTPRREEHKEERKEAPIQKVPYTAKLAGLAKQTGV